MGHRRYYTCFTTQIVPPPEGAALQELNGLLFSPDTGELVAAGGVAIIVNSDGLIELAEHESHMDSFTAAMQAVEHHLGAAHTIHGTVFVHNDYGGGVGGRVVLHYPVSAK